MAEFFKPRDFVHRVRLSKRERLAVGAAAGGLTKATYNIPGTGGADDVSYRTTKNPTGAIIQVLAQPLNFTVDGTTATVALGFVAQANDIIYLNTLQEIQNFSAIRNGGTDSAIEVVYLYGF
jgi:hypothetical protein